MRCPLCDHEQPDDNSKCIRCGLDFDNKYRRKRASTGGNAQLKAVFAPQQQRDTLGPISKGLLLILLAYWSVRFIVPPIAANAAGKSFLHMINLPFHEFGHVLFRPFSHLIFSLGGSLGQLLMPAICFFVLLLKTRDAFGAAVCLWWLGENFLDIAPYINDARSMTMPLLGGNFGDTAPYGFHDWNYILSETGLLAYDHHFAAVAEGIGILVMLGALAWAALLLFRPAAAQKC